VSYPKDVKFNFKIAKMFSVKTNMGSVTLVTVEDISRVHKSLIETFMYSRGGAIYIYKRSFLCQ
jgi:hypothetical protein